MLCGGSLDGDGPSEGDCLFYQITRSFVSLEDAGLDQAGQAVADVAGGGGTDAVDGLELGRRGGQDLGERAEPLDQAFNEGLGQLLR